MKVYVWTLASLLLVLAFQNCAKSQFKIHESQIGTLSEASLQPGLFIGSANVALSVNKVTQFTASGGMPPYTFSASYGKIIADTGVYTAPANPITDLVTVTDSTGQTKTFTLSIKAMLIINPSSVSLASAGTTTFSASGGVPPYLFSAATGTINSTSGVYTAINSAGTDVVKVTDSIGDASTATVTVAAAITTVPAPLVIVPGPTLNLVVNNGYSFSATGGTPPYSFLHSATTGSMDSGSGRYVASATAQQDTVTVTDTLGKSSSVIVTILPALSINATSLLLSVNNSQNITISGGLPPYTYAAVTGSFSANTYTAPGVEGTDVITVSDSLQNTVIANVVISPALSITSTPNSVVVNGIASVTVSGGVGPFTYTTTGGVYDQTTNKFTAGAIPLSASINVVDSLGNSAQISIVIKSNLKINPTTVSLLPGGSLTFKATLGYGAYTYSIVSQAPMGTITSTGIYTLPASAKAGTTEIIRAQDSSGNTAEATVTVAVPAVCSFNGQTILSGQSIDAFAAATPIPGSLCASLKIQASCYNGMMTPATAVPSCSDAGVVAGAVAIKTIKMDSSSGNSCAITALGKVMCWGDNLYGQIGDGTTVQRLLPVFVADTESYASITVGGTFACGILKSGLVKCWGQIPGISVSHSTPTLIASSETFVTISAGSGHLCGITSAGVAKCWGGNGSGQLGIGTKIGQAKPMAISDSETYLSISGGPDYSCGITSSKRVKCWGYNRSGNLGIGSVFVIESLIPAFTTDPDTYLSIATSFVHVCGISTSGVAKCWGANGWGELGSGAKLTADYPSPGPVADADTYKSIAVGDNGITFGVTTSGRLKSWGANIYGSLGVGSSTTFNVITPGLIPDSDTYESVTAGYWYGCGLTTSGVIKCWGYNITGSIGVGSTVDQLTPTPISTTEVF